MRKKRKSGKGLLALLGVCLILTAWIVWRAANAPPLVAGSQWEHLDFTTMAPEGALKWLEENAQAPLEERKAPLEDLAARRDAIGYLASLTLGEGLIATEAYGIGYLQQALGLYDTRELREKMAKAMLQGGETEEAKALYIGLLPDEEALNQLRALGVDPQEIGEILIDQKQYQGLLSFHDTLDEAEGQAPWRLGQQARAQAALGNYQEALGVFERLMEKEALEGTDLWWYGRTLEALERDSEAMSVYESLGEAGAYRLGLLLEKQGVTVKAAQSYEIAPEEVSGWKAAKLYEQMGDWERGLSIYQQLATAEGNYRYDAAYRAYILMDRHQIPGKEEMAVYLETQPAWLHRIGQEMQWHLDKPVQESPLILEKIDGYRQLGREDLAEIELSIIAKQGNQMDQIVLGEWYLAQGNYGEATRWGIRALKSGQQERAYHLSYQRPYEELVMKAAAAYDLDPYIIWSIMREESHYQAEAQSWVGAMGLMQIMPATGEEIASRLKVSLVSGQLLEPETNINFGAFYISRLLNLFEGNLDKALAAYNGGQGNVRKWEKSPLGTAPEDFPTAVVFYETQQYITKVTNTYLTYHWLYEGE